MRRLIFRFSVALAAFAAGIAAVWLIGLLTISPLTKTASISFTIYAREAPLLPNPFASGSKPRFSATSRGCGFGYIQSYETDDGQQLDEGVTGYATRKKSRAEFKKMIARALRVVERVPDYDRLGRSGERIVLINPPDGRNDKETVSILWHDGGQFIAFIDAPSMDLALEFEKFLEANNYASGF